MLAVPTWGHGRGLSPVGLGRMQAEGVRNGLDPCSLPSVGAPAPPALADKASLSLGEGWKEETPGPSCPAPYSSANELQRDGEGEGCGENGEVGGRPGYQPTWCPGPCHTSNTRPPGRRLSPQKLGLQSPGESVTPAGINSLHASVSPLAVSSCLRTREGGPQGLHTGARQPLGWGDPSHQTLGSAGVSRGLFSIFTPLGFGVLFPQHWWLQAGTPVPRLWMEIRISPVAGFLSQCTRWSWDSNPSLCDPKSWSKESEPSSPRPGNSHPREARPGLPTSVPLLSWSL